MDNNILFHGQCPWNLDVHGKTSLFHGIPCYVHRNLCIFHGKLNGSMEDLQPGIVVWLIQGHTAKKCFKIDNFRNLSLKTSYENAHPTINSFAPKGIHNLMKPLFIM